MTKASARVRACILAVGGILAALLAWPTGVAAHDGGGEVDLGLDALAISSVTVEPRTGLATVTGEIDCSQDIHVFVGAELAQVVGRTATISGSDGSEVDCLAADGSAAFEISFYPWSGKFAPGRARLQAFAETGYCDEFDCYFDSVSYGPTSVRVGR